MPRIEGYELQARKADQWVTFARGTTVGPQATVRFEPVTARKVRLLVNQAKGSPEIQEFHLFPPAE